MKVLMLTPLVPSEHASSAGAIVMHAELRALATRHEVTLATLATADDEASLAELRGRGITVRAVRRQPEAGVAGRWRRAEMGVRWRLGRLPFRTIVFYERGMQQLLDQLARVRFDVVHVSDNAMAAYRLPPSVAKVLTEYEVRVSASDGMLDGGSPPSSAAAEAERQRWWEYQAKVWAQFDRVQLFTEEDAVSARRVAPDVGERLRVNPFGVEAPPHSDPSNEHPDTLVFVGGFRHPPNVDAAIWLARDILPLVRARHPDARLTIVGADPPPSVRAEASGAVTVTGHVAQVEPYLMSAAVVVAPLRSGGGMRLKVLQAMALARPVVTTTRGAAGICNPASAATLRIADDAQGIAAQIADLLDSADERNALGTRARAAVIEHHHQDGFARRLEELYAELPPSGSRG